MIRCLTQGTFVAAVLVASPTFARTPIYAHKAAVTQPVMDEEEGACLKDAAIAKRDPKQKFPYSQGEAPAPQSFGAGLAGGLANGASQIMAGYKRYSLTIYDCMISKGYTMHQVSDVDWKALKKLPVPERQALWSKWRSAEAPVHPAVGREKF